MPTNEFLRPTLAAIFARVQSDIEGDVSGVTARIRRRVERGIAFAIAGVSDGLHGHLAWAVDQIFPDTAVERILLRWCAIFGVTRKVAERAAGNITVTGSGGDLAIGDQWVRAGDGVVYEVTVAEAGITNAVVAIRALVGAANSDLTVGASLSLVSPISGITSPAVVAAGGLTGGTDLESLSDLLTRLIDRIQRPPMGGAPGDYETWALEVAGVTSAWEYRGVDGAGNPGLGRVSVTFLVNDAIPDSGDVTELQEYLDARAPAEVIVFAPTASPFAATIQITPDTQAIRDAVLAEIEDMLARDTEPGTTLRLSRINEAISNAAGETSHDLLSPTEDVEHDFGVLPTYDANLIIFA